MRTSPGGWPLALAVVIVGCAPNAPPTPPPSPQRPQSTLATVKSVSSACPFPPESDVARIDSAAVQVQVTVAASGAVERVDVLHDPGHGFGRQAVTCLQQMPFTPGTDEQGRPTRTTTKPFRLRFER